MPVMNNTKALRDIKTSIYILPVLFLKSWMLSPEALSLMQSFSSVLSHNVFSPMKKEKHKNGCMVYMYYKIENRNLAAFFSRIKWLLQELKSYMQ